MSVTRVFTCVSTAASTPTARTAAGVMTGIGCHLMDSVAQVMLNSHEFQKKDYYFLLNLLSFSLSRRR